MNAIRNSSRIIMWILVLVIVVTGCKSKKKAAEAARAAEERARIEQEANLRQDEEAKRKQAEEESARRDSEARQNQVITNEPKAKLNQYFDAISSSGNMASANSSINEALTLFASPETPVLIVISESGGQKDYDRPTTIRQYLNYLKDQKKNINTISDLQIDSSGKITEVELRKN
ncbi:MAG: nucleoid-structuring protein H-NS [Cyclobacteriaceae bacterium]